MNIMTLIVSFAVIAALAALFVWWRWKNCLRRREPMGTETTWVMYLPPSVFYGFLLDNSPQLHIVWKLLAAAAVFTLGFIPFRLVTTRYEKSLEKAIEEDEEARWK